MRVDIRLLGGFDVIVDDEQLPGGVWRRRQAAALVKLLALQPGHRMLREQVMDRLWPDLTVEDAAPRLHKAAHYARTAFGFSDAVVLGDTVSLCPDAEVTVDVERFDAAAADDAPETAVHLYRGDLLPEDLYEPWAEEARETRRLRYLELLRAAERWDELVAADPTDEQAHLALARRLALAGDPRAALRQLDRMEHTLETELGVAPGDAARRLRAKIEELPQTAPPLEATDHGVRTHDASLTPSRLTPLPAPTSRIIGREDATAEALRLLERARVLTFLGPGGVGKTTLAVEVARRRSAAAEIESCFVDLTKVDRADLVPELVATELGIHRSTGSDAEQRIQEALRGRALLVVLDNFEHVVDAAGLVSQMAAWSPRLEVLSTSRARLQVSGEHVVDVPPLPVTGTPSGGDGESVTADAVALFDQVARAVDPHFELARHLDDVAAICRALEGLPLAIKLAAGHVRTLPPALLRARLRARLDSPAGAGRDAPPRQQTIPATIDWSLGLLGDDERRLFTRMGVFAGPVGLEAVEGVCGDPQGAGAPGGSGRTADVVEALARLVDQSLVRRLPGPRGEVRYGMLDLLRERARQLLAEGEDSGIRERHARYVAGVVAWIDEHRWTDASDRWIDLLTDALPEIRAAHTWADEHGDTELAARITAALGTYWHREGHHGEGRRWVADALRDADAYDDTLRARLLVAAGFVTWPTDPVTARGHWSESIDRFRALGDDRYLSYSLGLLSGTWIGDREGHDRAVAMCDESIALARQVGEAPLIAQALNIRGELDRVYGDDESALAAYTEGMAQAAAAHDDAHVSVFLANLAYLADHRGDYEEARRLGRQALRTCWSLGRRMMAAWTVSEMAGPEIGLGRPEHGARLVGAADQALAVLGVTRHPGDLLEHERVVAQLRAGLGDEGFERLAAEGAALSLHEAVLMAMGEGEELEGQRGAPVPETRAAAPAVPGR
jgi:predicted ATPase/DNA-binding SARP family transcriptional activator